MRSRAFVQAAPWTKAFRVSLWASMRSRQACTISTGETSPDLSRAASSETARAHRSVIAWSSDRFKSDRRFDIFQRQIAQAGDQAKQRFESHGVLPGTFAIQRVPRVFRGNRFDGG